MTTRRLITILTLGLLAAGASAAETPFLKTQEDKSSCAVGAAPAPPPKGEPKAAVMPADDVEQKWGIRIIGPYLSGGGNLVDFRYKVLDSAKAAPLTKRENKPSLFNPANGTKLLIPDTPKLGQLRQVTPHPTEGKVYFMLFANTRHHVKHGDKVTITAGECKLENLTVD